MNKKEDVYIITSIVLMIDQFIKIIVNHYMNINSSITLIPNFFSLTYVKNTGAAFSILENNTVLLIVISSVFIIILDRYIKQEENLNKGLVITFGLILGGIFGNLIDRIIHHGVIDYLDFKIFNYNFPIFNIADIAITVGAFIYVIIMIKTSIKERTK